MYRFQPISSPFFYLCDTCKCNNLFILYVRTPKFFYFYQIILSGACVCWWLQAENEQQKKWNEMKWLEKNLVRFNRKKYVFFSFWFCTQKIYTEQKSWLKSQIGFSDAQKKKNGWGMKLITLYITFKYNLYVVSIAQTGVSPINNYLNGVGCFFFFLAWKSWNSQHFISSSCFKSSSLAPILEIFFGTCGSV